MIFREQNSERNFSFQVLQCRVVVQWKTQV